MTVTVLTSGVGLGSYVAALLHAAELGGAEVEVIEGCFTDAHRERHLKHRSAFARDFRLALAGRAMAGGVQDRLDPERVDALVDRWVAEGRTRFAVWSGYWLPVLERVPGAEALLCRIDAVESDSFRVHPAPAGAEELWLWNGERRALGHRLPLPAGDPVPFPAREHRLAAHGGGWGIGTFTDVLGELAGTGFALDVMGPEVVDWDGRGPDDRRFTADPAWRPWDGTFPPLKAVGGAVRRRDDYPPAHDHVRAARAIVSKPGGGTLLDSLAAATPVVLLEPWGTPEARNGALWTELGFGIPFDDWRASGFDPAVLEALHANLLAARAVTA